ncbi:hypothetical protein CFC21_069143 [Triticum aestivum]|uniref:Uncharacterized protein n=3 Tax=Triticum TaxID=4564 RepID=A0A9R1P496_TRITD|nr:hypothetical protein CFC21_069143 [Triticum aestivum]VAH36362.1 unnamed protein product [Triticum turgidum subsp. durum]
MDCVSIEMPDPLPHAPAAGMVDAVHDDAKLQRALVGGGVAKSSAALYLAFFRAPAGVFLLDGPLVAAYYVILAAVVVFAALEVATGFWVAGDPRGRRGKAKVVLWASVVPLVLVAALGGFAVLR